jgi:hypothetical protein
MGEVVRASEAVAEGVLSRGVLRSSYRPIFPNVHAPRGKAVSLRSRTVGAWLWTKRRAVITGRAAAALHGALWIDEHAPIELIALNNRPPVGIITRLERVGQDEVIERFGMAVATVQRTAFDLGRFLPRDAAVAHLDALAQATRFSAADVLPLAVRYKGARGAARFKKAIGLMDAGAQSPKETWLRLLLIDAGFPRPRTQIPVLDEYGYAFAYLDMGWDDVMVAVEYDGEHHRTDPVRYRKDIRRLERIEHRGWIIIRVIAGDRPSEIVARVRTAWARRESETRVAKRAG